MMAFLAKQASQFPFEDVLTQTETSDKNKKIITVNQYYPTVMNTKSIVLQFLIIFPIA